MTSSSTSSSDGRRFAGRAFALLLPLVVGALALEVFLGGVTSSQLQAKQKLLEPQLAELQVLSLGSSHGVNGIEPHLLGARAFNLALNSQSLYYDAELARKYLDRMPKLRLVILPISYLSLEYQLDDSAEAWRCYYYHRFFGLPHRRWIETLSPRNYSLVLLYGKDESLDLLTGAAPRDVRGEFDDWGGLVATRPSPESEPFGAAAARRVLERHARAMSPTSFVENVAILERLIDELHRRGIAVALVTTPVSRAYADGMDRARYQRMQDALARLVREHHVVYANHMLDPSFTDRDFHDADHLSPIGAARFRVFSNTRENNCR